MSRFEQKRAEGLSGSRRIDFNLFLADTKLITCDSLSQLPIMRKSASALVLITGLTELSCC